MKGRLHGLQVPLGEVLRYVRCELPAEDVTRRPPSGVIGGVDQDVPGGAVEKVVQVPEEVRVIR